MVTMVLLKVEPGYEPDPQCSSLFRASADILPFLALFAAISIPPYFFLLATVRLGPLQVRALVLVRWPRTGRPLRWRMPR